MLLAMLLTFIFIEIGIRIFVPQSKYYQPRYLFTADKKFGYVLTPNFEGKMQTPESTTSIKINSNGLRDYEHEGKKRFSILGLGDSFTFGTGVEVEDTYLWRLEDILNKKHGNMYEIVKAGVPGYGTDQEYIFLKNKGLEYKPDLVIIGFYINDVLDSVIPNFTVKDGYNVPSQATRKHFEGKKFHLKLNLSILANELHTPSFVINRLSTNPFFKKLFLRIVEISKGKEGNRQKLYVKFYSPNLKKAWAVTLRYLKDIDTLIKEQNGKVLLVYIPERQQVYEEQWKRILHQYELSDKDYDILKPNKTLREFCETENIAFLDLTPGLRRGINTEELYFTMDPHLNSKGHELTAKLIYEKLLNEIQY